MSTIPDAVRTSYGSLPDGWQMERLKFSCVVRNSNVDKVIAEDEETIRLCNYTDVYYNDRITPEMEFTEGSATSAEIERFRLMRGQVLITKDSESWEDIGIPALVTEDMPDVVCGYHLSVLDPVKHHLDGAYLAWLCRSAPLNNQFKLGANGVTRFGLGQYPMKNAFIALPPVETQRRTAEFLDGKTAQIDALIEKKRALLDRLAEKRQALITHAVTKGLNPSAPMKYSGIDWLGEIPAHWEALPVKRALKGIEQGWSPSGEERIAEADEWGILKSGCVNGGVFDETNHKTLPPSVDPKPHLEVGSGDVLMCRASGSLHYIGSVAVVKNVRKLLMFSDKTYRLLLAKKNIDTDYFVFSMASKYLREQVLLSVSGADGLANNIAQSSVKNYLICMPPMLEQIDISQHLFDRTRAIGVAAARIRSSIGSLTEYRSALITAAVTGQLDLEAA